MRCPDCGRTDPMRINRGSKGVGKHQFKCRGCGLKHSCQEDYDNSGGEDAAFSLYNQFGI